MPGPLFPYHPLNQTLRSGWVVEQCPRGSAGVAAAFAMLGWAPATLLASPGREIRGPRPVPPPTDCSPRGPQLRRQPGGAVRGPSGSPGEEQEEDTGRALQAPRQSKQQMRPTWSRRSWTLSACTSSTSGTSARWAWRCPQRRVPGSSVPAPPALWAPPFGVSRALPRPPPPSRAAGSRGASPLLGSGRPLVLRVQSPHS